MSDWWRDYFDDTYLPRYMISDEVTEAEVAMLRELLPPPPARVLDVACGQGRHSIALALAGYDVTGLDASPTLLDQARQHAQEAGTSVAFVEGDMRAMPYDSDFDAAINMFTAFGYFADDAENQRALDSMARALRPGGRLVMELANRDYVVATYRTNDWYELDDGTVVWVQRHFDPVRGLSTVIDRWRTPDGAEDERYHRTRLYTATELDRMLRAGGLTPRDWYGDTDLHALALGARRIVVVAER